jgi:biopolymer transport protein ExbB/TolQ
MLLLAIASVVSWMMIFQRWLFLRRAINDVDSLEDHFWSGIDLREFYGELSNEENLNGIETYLFLVFVNIRAYLNRRAWMLRQLCRGFNDLCEWR